MPWSTGPDVVILGVVDVVIAAVEPAAVVVESVDAVVGVGVLRPLLAHGFMEPSSVVFSGFLSPAGGPIVSSASSRSLRAAGRDADKGRQPSAFRTCFQEDAASEL